MRLHDDPVLIRDLHTFVGEVEDTVIKAFDEVVTNTLTQLKDARNDDEQDIREFINQNGDAIVERVQLVEQQLDETWVTLSRIEAKLDKFIERVIGSLS